MWGEPEAARAAENKPVCLAEPERKQSQTETLQPRSSQHRILQNHEEALHLNKVDEYVMKTHTHTHFSVIYVFGCVMWSQVKLHDSWIIIFLFYFWPNVGYYFLFVLLFLFLFNNLKVFISLFHDCKNIFISVKHKSTQVKFIIINITIIILTVVQLHTETICELSCCEGIKSTSMYVRGSCLYLIKSA